MGTYNTTIILSNGNTYSFVIEAENAENAQNEIFNNQWYAFKSNLTNYYIRTEEISEVVINEPFSSK